MRDKTYPSSTSHFLSLLGRSCTPRHNIYLQHGLLDPTKQRTMNVPRNNARPVTTQKSLDLLKAIRFVRGSRKLPEGPSHESLPHLTVVDEYIQLTTVLGLELPCECTHGLQLAQVALHHLMVMEHTRTQSGGFTHWHWASSQFLLLFMSRPDAMPMATSSKIESLISGHGAPER